jgi:dipeptidyl aminopeptidase/acylaminoacyl peptidase
LSDDYNSATCIIACMLRKLLCAVSCLMLLSCTPQARTPTQTSLYIHRLNPSAFVEFSTDFQPVREIPFSSPPDCSLLDVFPAPVGKYLLVELSCPNGQTVLFLDSESGSVTQPLNESDSHFLAWANDGKSAYLKLDSLGNTHVGRVDPQGRNVFIPVTAYSYDLSPDPSSDNFTFTFSRGLGQGSELWLARHAGKVVQQLYADPLSYISFARYSPDGKQIAFIKIPDSQTPFTVGELWVMDSDGSQARKLTDADAGHGYAANWSPDGKWIAFVKRENVSDKSADQSAESLISNIYLANLQSGEIKPVTTFTNSRAETPHWSPDGNILAFNTVLDGRMEVQTADIASGEIQSLTTEPACCPAWMRK